jgi:hypothetical protein
MRLDYLAILRGLGQAPENTDASFFAGSRAVCAALA